MLDQEQFDCPCGIDNDGDGMTDCVDNDCGKMTDAVNESLSGVFLAGEPCTTGSQNPCSVGLCSENHVCIPVDPSCY